MAVSDSELGAYLRRAVLAVIVVICVAAVVAAVRTHSSRKAYRAVYRLDAAGAKDTESDLQRTVAVLTGRLEALQREFKLGRCSVRSLPPDRVEVKISCADSPQAPLAWLTMQGKAEFRLLHPEDGILTKAGRQALPPEYEVKVYKERRYILSRLGDLKTVETEYAILSKPSLVIGRFKGVTMTVTGAGQSVVLTFRFSEEDARAFGALTALNAGRKMAMLVDGEIFFPPKEIESAVPAGSVQVQGFFYIPPVRRLAEMLDAGSLPLPLTEESRAPAGVGASTGKD
jgi:preprotein translocase subunit SecD